MEATQLLKGVLDAAVLAAVQQADGYGYDVVRRLREAGLAEVGDASVYGTLRRLYAAGALSTYVVPSDDGPHRKYYSITPAGIELLQASRDTWRAFSTVISDMLLDESATSAATAAIAASDARPLSAPMTGQSAPQSVAQVQTQKGVRA